jgi:hypothetical protein
MKELVSHQQVVRLKFKLQGGTPFARSDISKDEVSTRRYGWRAVAKAMHMDGMNKNSEIEIKVIPLSTLPEQKRVGDREWKGRSDIHYDLIYTCGDINTDELLPIPSHHLHPVISIHFRRIVFGCLATSSSPTRLWR